MSNTIRKVVIHIAVPITLVLVIIFVLWLRYEIGKSNQNNRKSSDTFWELERKANSTRKVDISDLHFITVSLDKLPMADHQDSTINSYRDTILKLSDKQIFNLTGLTNTDLKLKYGAANLNILMDYDNNYILLVSILQKWGERLYSLGDVAKAVSVLEQAIMCQTDAIITYRLLVKIYRELNKPDKITNLINNIKDSTINRKKDILSELNKELSSYS